MGLGRVLRTPDLLQQLALADQLARMTDEQLEQVPLGRGQVYRLATLPWPDNVIGYVHSILSYLDRCGRLARRREPAGHGPDAGQQLIDPERLGDVVVGPGIERVHLVRAVGP